MLLNKFNNDHHDEVKHLTWPLNSRFTRSKHHHFSGLFQSPSELEAFLHKEWSDMFWHSSGQVWQLSEEDWHCSEESLFPSHMPQWDNGVFIQCIVYLWPKNCCTLFLNVECRVISTLLYISISVTKKAPTLMTPSQSLSFRWWLTEDKDKEIKVPGEFSC